MGAYQRRKGAVGERELVNALKAAGIGATRISPLEAGGASFGDVKDAQGQVWQVKRRARSPLYEMLDGCDRLAIRADDEGWLVVLGLDEYLDLVADKEREHNA